MISPANYSIVVTASKRFWVPVLCANLILSVLLLIPAHPIKDPIFLFGKKQKQMLWSPSSTRQWNFGKPKFDDRRCMRPGTLLRVCKLPETSVFYFSSSEWTETALAWQPSDISERMTWKRQVGQTRRRRTTERAHTLVPPPSRFIWMIIGTCQKLTSLLLSIGRRENTSLRNAYLNATSKEKSCKPISIE